MIHCNGNIEFQSSLNEEEAKWWQNRVQELGLEPEIISRDPEEVESIEEAVDYLIAKGNGIIREALGGSKLAISVFNASKLFHDYPDDPGSRALLEIIINEYIQSKRFTLSIKNSDCRLECPRCGSKNIIGHVGECHYNTCDKCAKSF